MPYKQKGMSLLIMHWRTILFGVEWIGSELAYKESEMSVSRADCKTFGVGLARVSAGATGETVAEEEEVDGPRAESS